MALKAFGRFFERFGRCLKVLEGVGKVLGFFKMVLEGVLEIFEKFQKVLGGFEKDVGRLLKGCEKVCESSVLRASKNLS